MLDLTRIEEAIRYEGRISRRLLLAYAAALAAIPMLGLRARGQSKKKAKLPDDVFKALGVASGEPDHNSVVLWTRLAPRPEQEDGDSGMPRADFTVRWEIWPADGKKKVIDSGSVEATPELGHSIHVVAKKLRPGSWYQYQFHCGDQSSPIGRTRTMPAPTDMPAQLRFAFASCQNYEDGLYTAYQHMARDNPDLVVFLGDYIYENDAPEKTVREHIGKKLDKSLAAYRARYGQYKSDPLLRAMHELCPWLVTWDDHEVEGNYANDISKHWDKGKGPSQAQFLVRRAHAYQAFYENVPVRPGRAKPDGPKMDLYHSTTFGRLASFQVLDTRQYRTDQPNGGEMAPINKDAQDPRNTLLGAKQKKWLMKTLEDSKAIWNVLAQQVMMALVDRATGSKQQYSMDAWPGYFHEREELIRFLAEKRIKNPVVLTGDIHSNWVNNLRVDDRKHNTPVVATEFVVTSISSKGNGKEVERKRLSALLDQNPCLKYHDDQRGYVRCTVTPKEWKSEYRAVSDVTKPGGKASTTATFVVAEGKPSAKK
jgi:alkaline phosphatase D